MFDEYKYKFELHAHTSPVSGCSEILPVELIRNYHEQGVDGVVITNHFTPDLPTRFPTLEEAVDFYMHDYDIAREEGEKLGMTVLFGLEIRFSENYNDYLLYGISREDVTAAIKTVSGTLAEFRKSFHSDRSVFIQAHPCRNGIEPIDLSLVDGIEAFNMHPHHNSRVAFAAKLASENGKIATCGTDYHHLTHEASGLTRFKKLPKDNFELADMLKSNDYVFDINGFLVLPPEFQTLHDCK